MILRCTSTRHANRRALALLACAGIFASPQPASACVRSSPPRLIRISIDGASWTGWDFHAIRCKDTSRAFVVGRTFHADSLAESLFRDSLEIPRSEGWLGDGYSGGLPAIKRTRNAAGNGPRGWMMGSSASATSTTPRTNAEWIEWMSRRVNDTGTVAPEPRQWPETPRTGGMNYRTFADFLNPITVFAVARGNEILGRMRRAHLLGGIRGFRCPCLDCFEGQMLPDGEASENVFSQLAHDPDHCALFGRTWTGLWYFVDGKTGRFHDVVVPDTVTEWKVPSRGWIQFPRAIGISMILLGIVVVGAAIRSFVLFPTSWRVKLAMAMLSLAAAWMVPLPHETAWDRIGRLRRSQDSGMLEAWIPRNPVIHPIPGIPYRTTDSGLVCDDRDHKVVVSLPGGPIGRLDMFKGGRLTKTVALDGDGSPPIVAWDSVRCSGFAQTSRKEFVQFDARSGKVRAAFLRDEAHFFSWPDTTPEVPKWWRDDLLLPPGREPDVLLLPPAPRLEIPIPFWFTWIRFVTALLLAWISLGAWACAFSRPKTADTI